MKKKIQNSNTKLQINFNTQKRIFKFVFYLLFDAWKLVFAKARSRNEIIHVIAILLFISANINLASAATPAPSSAPPKPAQPTESSTSATFDRIEKIKEMVASRVAELKLVEKRGFVGIVKESSTNEIILETDDGDERTIDIDELTKFEHPTSKSFGISDIDKNDKIGVVGLYNKDTEYLLARVIMSEKNFPQQLDAVVTAKNARAFQLSVSTNTGETKTIDIANSTKISSFSKDSDMTKSNLSKIEVGQRILVTGFNDKDDRMLLIADRLIHFLDLPLSPQMKQAVNTEKPTPQQ